MLIDYGRTNAFSKAATISWELRPRTLKVQKLLQGDAGVAGMRHRLVGRLDLNHKLSFLPPT